MTSPILYDYVILFRSVRISGFLPRGQLFRVVQSNFERHQFRQGLTSWNRKAAFVGAFHYVFVGKTLRRPKDPMLKQTRLIKKIKKVYILFLIKFIKKNPVAYLIVMLLIFDMVLRLGFIRLWSRKMFVSGLKQFKGCDSLNITC